MELINCYQREKLNVRIILNLLSCESVNTRFIILYNDDKKFQKSQPRVQIHTLNMDFS